MSEHTSTVTEWQVQGMTCGHCVASVTEELTELPGVESVDVELETGRVTVTSSTELRRTDVEAAVTEAGYALV
jgi:copper ion binding protein